MISRVSIYFVQVFDFNRSTWKSTSIIGNNDPLISFSLLSVFQCFVCVCLSVWERKVDSLLFQLLVVYDRNNDEVKNIFNPKKRRNRKNEIEKKQLTTGDLMKRDAFVRYGEGLRRTNSSQVAPWCLGSLFSLTATWSWHKRFLFISSSWFGYQRK